MFFARYGAGQLGLVRSVAIKPRLHFFFGFLQIGDMRLSAVGQRTALLIIHDAVNEAVGERCLRVHPCGRGHHGSDFVPCFLASLGVDVENALLADTQKINRPLQITLVAPSDCAGVMDHEKRARGHLQLVRGHRQYGRRRSRRARYGNEHIAGVGADIVEHAGGRVARSAVAVQPDMHIVGKRCVSRTVQRLVQAVRRDLIAKPDFIIDVAVQVYVSQFSSLLSAQTIPARTKNTQFTQTELPKALYSAPSVRGSLSHLRNRFSLGGFTFLP